MAGLVTFSLARFDRARVPALLATVPVERLRLRRQPGLAWGRHLGTAAGAGTLGADPARWAWFCAWDDPDGAIRFHEDLEARLGPLEVATLALRTIRAHGRWAGHELVASEKSPGEGPLVVLTRARVRARRWRTFRAAAPPVNADLARAAGLVRSIGVGEWPVLVQGSLSIWHDTRAMTTFARTQAHQTAVRRTAEEDWYAEEMFARFAVEGIQGTWDGMVPL